MRVALLLALLVVPSAAAWSVSIDAPRAAGAGLPFLVEVCAQAEGEGQVRILAENATLDVREDRYLPPFADAACRDVEVRPHNGTVRLEARVRDAGSQRVQARASADTTLMEGGFVASRTGVAGDLRAPLVDGWALLPAPPGEGARVRIAEARAPPMEGALLVNDGPGDAQLAVYRLGGARFSDQTLAAGASLFVPIDVKAGTLQLTAGARVESALLVPKLRPGEGTLGRYGRTNLTAETFDVAGDITAHVASMAPVVALVDEARAEVLVEAYTLTSPDVAAALARAADRGARVRVLLEGAPVGGVPADERALVATLQARGAQVLALGGEGARYRSVHAKLVVVDRQAVSVATENLGEGSARGYGLVVRDAALAARVAEVIDADLAGHDVAPFVPLAPPGEALPRALEAPASARVEGARATLVLSPDDPLALARLVASARASVDVEMLRADADGPMIDALLAAARNGSRVRVLLDGRFDDGTNRETAARLAATALRERLDLEATLDRADRTLHAKVVVVDARAVYVGSMNWVRAALYDNREAGLIVESEELARWFQEEMEKARAGPADDGREVPGPRAQWLLLALLLTRLRRGRRSPA